MGILEKAAELWNIPFALAEFRKSKTVRLILGDLEIGAKRSAGTHHAQIAVEEQ
jgi:hypothetical protein